MTLTDDLRPVLVAAFAAMLFVLAAVLTDPVVPALSPSLGLGDNTVAVSAEDLALPDWMAHLPACDVDRAWSTCPDRLAPAADSVGWIDATWGRADGWLAAGEVDRFDVTAIEGPLTVSVDGDRGTVLGIYAAGHALLDPADGMAWAGDLVLPEGLDRVQVLVINPTDAARDYELRIE